MRRAASPDAGAVDSRSRRSICCPCETARVFSVVGRVRSTTRVVVIRGSRLSNAASMAPCSSAPRIPTRSTRAPSAATLRATFAAPPSRKASRSTVNTGTGASGEIRVTVPWM